MAFGGSKPGGKPKHPKRWRIQRGLGRFVKGKGPGKKGTGNQAGADWLLLLKAESGVRLEQNGKAAKAREICEAIDDGTITWISAFPAEKQAAIKAFVKLRLAGMLTPEITRTLELEKEAGSLEKMLSNFKAI